MFTKGLPHFQDDYTLVKKKGVTVTENREGKKEEKEKEFIRFFVVVVFITILP